jgi:hypothetical protein
MKVIILFILLAIHSPEVEARNYTIQRSGNAIVKRGGLYNPNYANTGHYNNRAMYCDYNYCSNGY